MSEPHANHSRRYLVIGDIHGCIDELTELLLLVGDDDRQVISLGDVLDRGPDSGACVRLLREVGARLVLGNHEEKHLRALRPGSKAQLGKHHLETRKQLDPEDWDWIAEAEPYIFLPDYSTYLVHAGVHADHRPESMPRDRICRVQMTKKGLSSGDRSPWANWSSSGKAELVGKSAEKALTEGYRWWTELAPIGRYVYGHTTFPSPLLTFFATEEVHKIDKMKYEIIFGRPIHDYADECSVWTAAIVRAFGIDTGAPFGGALTGLLIPEMTFVRVESKDTYFGTKDLNPDYAGDDGSAL